MFLNHARMCLVFHTVINSNQQNLTCIIFDPGGILLILDLLDCTFRRPIPLQLYHQRWAIHVTLRNCLMRQ